MSCVDDDLALGEGGRDGKGKRSLSADEVLVPMETRPCFPCTTKALFFCLVGGLAASFSPGGRMARGRTGWVLGGLNGWRVVNAARRCQ